LTPVSPVAPGLDLPEVVYAKDQPQYIPLPAYRYDDGTVVTRWRLSWRERLAVLFGGSIWLTLLTFNKPLQPVMLDAKCPILNTIPCCGQVESPIQ
jgi:hypothetical protein